MSGITNLDRGLWLSLQAIRRQLTAMPHELFLIRLIHHLSRRPYPGERLWTPTQLLNPATVRFLRIRNSEGCDIYLQPYAEDQNAGYILLDLDRPTPSVLQRMWLNGHNPCVVLQTSRGHLQAWVRVSMAPLEPTTATAIGKYLARMYGGDLASTDWRHLGRLAGFTNQKPQRRTPNGNAPWVKIVYNHVGLARNADALLESALVLPDPGNKRFDEAISARRLDLVARGASAAAPPRIEAAEAVKIYAQWMHRWRIAERFPLPDWSIVDLWIARELLSQGIHPKRVQDILRLGSPDFPRGHTNPDDYLRRTLGYAVRDLAPFPFPTSASECSPARQSRPSPAACVNPLAKDVMDGSVHG